MVDLRITDTLGQLYLLSARGFSPLRGSQCSRTVGRSYLEPQAVSLLERFIVLCSCLGESTIRGSTVGPLIGLQPHVHAYLPAGLRNNSHTYVLVGTYLEYSIF